MMASFLMQCYSHYLVMCPSFFRAHARGFKGGPINDKQSIFILFINNHIGGDI